MNATAIRKPRTSRYEKSLTATLALRESCARTFLPLFDHCVALARSSYEHGYPQRAGRELLSARRAALSLMCGCGAVAIRGTSLCSAHTPSCWRIYDAGPSVTDRYSVLVEDGNERWDGGNRFQTCLSVSEGGRAVSQFSEALPGKHLGKRVKLDQLDAATRNHILSRLMLEQDLKVEG